VGVALGGKAVAVGVPTFGVRVGLTVAVGAEVSIGRLHSMDIAKGVAPAAINLKNLLLFIDCSFIDIHKIYDL